MADSIREQIIKKLKAKLETITVANGYENTVASVQRFKLSGQVYAIKPVIVIHEGGDDGRDAPDPLTSRALEIALECVMTHDEVADSRSSEEVVNTLRADLTKALMANRQWDGLAIDTEDLSFGPIFSYEKLPDLVFAAETTISYRHRYDNPYSLT